MSILQIRDQVLLILVNRYGYKNQINQESDLVKCSNCITLLISNEITAEDFVAISNSLVYVVPQK